MRFRLSVTARTDSIAAPSDAFVRERSAKNVLDVIENEVLPAWNEGDEKWCEIMRASIATSARFTGARMISDYLRFYESFE